MIVTEDSIVVTVMEPSERAEVEAGADSGRGRRASERAIRYWQQRTSLPGSTADLAALDLSHFDSEEWSCRFVMTIDPMLDGSSLLLYGSDVARLLDLPPDSKARVPIMRRLPARYVPVFRRGCAAVLEHNAPVRVEGELVREDGRQELFRAIIIPLGDAERHAVRFAFGAFSGRVG